MKTKTQTDEKNAIEWAIEPFKRGDIPTGDVQIWANVSEKQAEFIINAVKNHKAVLEAAKAGLLAIQSQSYTGQLGAEKQLKEAIAQAERGK